MLSQNNDEIISALEQQKWTDRSIMKGDKYTYPKKEFYFFSMEEKEFKKILSSESELVYKLAKDIGIGGTYAEEICIISGVDKIKKKLNEEELKKVFSAFEKIIGTKINARITYEGGRIKDIVPFELEIYKDLEKKEFSSFNEAFDYFFKDEFTSKEEFKSKHQSIIDKTNTIILQQRKQVEELDKKADEETKKAEMIYENYQMIEKILSELNKAREKYTFDEIKEKLKGHKIVKEINPKEKKVVIKL